MCLSEAEPNGSEKGDKAEGKASLRNWQDKSVSLSSSNLTCPLHSWRFITDFRFDLACRLGFKFGALVSRRKGAPN